MDFFLSHSLLSKRRSFLVTRLLISGRVEGGGSLAGEVGGTVTAAKKADPEADMAKARMEGRSQGPIGLLGCGPSTLHRPLAG